MELMLIEMAKHPSAQKKFSHSRHEFFRLTLEEIAQHSVLVVGRIRTAHFDGARWLLSEVAAHLSTRARSFDDYLREEARLCSIRRLTRVRRSNALLQRGRIKKPIASPPVLVSWQASQRKWRCLRVSKERSVGGNGCMAGAIKP